MEVVVASEVAAVVTGEAVEVVVALVVAAAEVDSRWDPLRVSSLSLK